jgi:SAM-dependent methyltransferase
METVLHVFRHGCGDCIQFTSVLRHLAEQYGWVQDVVCAGKGKHSAFKGLARNVYPDSEPDHKGYSKVFDHAWDECWECWPDSPATKTALCLRRLFKLQPRWDLLNYTIQVSDETRDRARKYLTTVPTVKGYVFLHYEGNTSAGSKNLDHRTVRHVCDYLTESGYTPVILDWDRRSPLPDGKTVFCPDVDNPVWQGYGTGDAETIAALLDQADLFVGIDSGPQKVAFAVNVPTIAVWTKHHPLHYADRTDNAVHLVPAGHESMIRGNREAGLHFFQQNYWHVPYRHLAPDLINQIARKLGLNPMSKSQLLTAQGYDEEYYQEHKAAGLDYLNYGDWQRRYGRWVIQGLGMAGKHVLDVGCACGSIAAGMAEAGGLVSGIDLSQHMINLGRAKWRDFPLFVCDAVNLHLWPDNTFDFLHSAQVFEHYKPELVPFILKELCRVTKPGGILFACFDTEELFKRQGRWESKDEDPTHVCVKPLAWWEARLQEAGWELAPDCWQALKDHPDTFFKQYDWDGLCARKKA